MQDIKEIELRERKSNTNILICFEVRVTALCTRLHTKGFQLSTIESFTQRPPLRNYNSTPEYTTPSLYTITSTQERKESKEDIKLSDPMITNSLFVILKNHKQFFLQYKDLKDRYRINSTRM